MLYITPNLRYNILRSERRERMLNHDGANKAIQKI